MMAHSAAIKERAKELYLIDGKKIKEIAEILNIKERTIANWKERDTWDQTLSTGGTVGTFLRFYKEFTDNIQKAINDKTLGDSKTSDSLLKQSKLLETLMPTQMILSNMFEFMKDVTVYFAEHIKDQNFIQTWQDHIVPLGDYLRKKYAWKAK